MELTSYGCLILIRFVHIFWFERQFFNPFALKYDVSWWRLENWNERYNFEYLLWVWIEVLDVKMDWLNL